MINAKVTEQTLVKRCVTFSVSPEKLPVIT